MAKSTTFKGQSKPMGKSGHFHEPRRHSLQAQGFKTGHPADAVPAPKMSAKPIDYAQKVKSTIISMLKENTGTQMMDSGGASGRAWQINQTRKLDKEPEYSIESYGDNDLTITKSTYHFLAEHLDEDKETDKFNKEYEQKFKDSDEAHLSDMEEWSKYVQEKYGAKGLYGEGEPFVNNTYNGEDALDQTLQYLYYEIDGQGYVALQIHGGADVRGGYTKPHIFKVDADSGFLQNADVTIRFKDGSYADSDDAGYHWQGDDGMEWTIKPVPHEGSETKPKFVLVNGEKKEVSY